MVIRPSQLNRQAAWLMTEMLVAIGILLTALLPIAYSFRAEARLARSLYTRAIAMELVDGEAEVLAAGAWRAFTPGLHEYVVKAGAVTNLPPGTFRLTVETNRVRLDWVPAVRAYGGTVSREFSK